MDKSLRTMAFVPGYMTKFLEKAIYFEADALILDLEDSVPENKKKDARKNIKDYLDKNIYKQQVYIRVNSINSGLLMDDISSCLHNNIDGLMPTKVEDERDIIYFDKLLTQLESDNNYPKGKFKLCPLVETCSAVMRAYEIATASPRMIALAFGGEDYLTDLDGLHKEHGTSLLFPRSHIVLAARAAGIEVVDTPFLDIKDLERFKIEVELARELGFSGTLILHPDQIPVANEAFTPSPEEIKESQRIVNAIKEGKKKGLGVTLLDGKLIGPPMQKRAEKILSKIEKINNAKVKT